MENFYSDKAVVTRDGLMVVEKATAETVLVRSASLAAEMVDHVIIAVVVGYEVPDYVKNVKTVHNYNEFVNLNYETARTIISDIVPIEETYNIAKNTNYSLTVDKKDNIDHVFDKEKALTSQIMNMFSQRKKGDSMRKEIDTITKMKKENIQNRLMVIHWFLLMERYWLNSHITRLKVLPKNTRILYQGSMLNIISD